MTTSMPSARQTVRGTAGDESQLSVPEIVLGGSAEVEGLGAAAEGRRAGRSAGGRARLGRLAVRRPCRSPAAPALAPHGPGCAGWPFWTTVRTRCSSVFSIWVAVSAQATGLYALVHLLLGHGYQRGDQRCRRSCPASWRSRREWCRCAVECADRPPRGRGPSRRLVDFGAFIRAAPAPGSRPTGTGESTPKSIGGAQMLAPCRPGPGSGSCRYQALERGLDRSGPAILSSLLRGLGSGLRRLLLGVCRPEPGRPQRWPPPPQAHGPSRATAVSRFPCSPLPQARLRRLADLTIDSQPEPIIGLTWQTCESECRLGAACVEHRSSLIVFCGAPRSPVAQLAEHATVNRRVTGSFRVGGAKQQVRGLRLGSGERSSPGKVRPADEAQMISIRRSDGTSDATALPPRRRPAVTATAAVPNVGQGPARQLADGEGHEGPELVVGADPGEQPLRDVGVVDGLPATVKNSAAAPARNEAAASQTCSRRCRAG